MHVWRSRDGVRLAADSWGDPDGVPVILLHGSGQTRHAWSRTGQFLGEAGFYAVAFDARGHGDSDWSPNANYSQSAMVRDLECVAATFGGRPPILIGASMGGGASLLAVGEFYLDARALILVDIAPHTEPAGVARIHAFMRQKPNGFASLDEVAETIGQYRSHPAHSGKLDSLARTVRFGEDGKYRWHWDPCFVSWPRDLARRHKRLSASARRLKLPTLLVRGERSDIVTEAAAREFLHLCPHAEYVNVRDAGHTFAGEHNDRFGRAAFRFLERNICVR
jgi:non-heme chloroperoxidase